MFYSILVYIEYQSVCPSSELGPLHPLPRKRVWLPPEPKWGEDTLACGGVAGVGGDPIQRKGQNSGPLCIL